MTKPPPARPTKLLFVCSQNRIRSLTAERMFDWVPQYQARSAGTNENARVKVTAGLLGWADKIFVMQKSHHSLLRMKFSEALEGKDVVALNVPDDYCFMQPELIDELRAKLSQHLDMPENLRLS